ncbi:hypothetical protein NEHOM01_1071 [Nematocida homosporus]|uniref:uncharacterized protein n=1 Tax=Nematocida homosporus TaxID=1912981 RepID=UPI002220286A|nr:uncharacterized protein NEHOM01_1071 [Nematocida homosporus]KAI5185794.1 hypothetical protein NEHOM01_1071 [Nematocida homosporus]
MSMSTISNTKNEAKRMQALLELFQSEAEYTYDLILWTRTFKHLVVNTSNLSTYNKQVFISNVMLNSQSIFDLHDEIFQVMCTTFSMARNTPKEVFLAMEISTEQVEEVCSAIIKRKARMLQIYSEYANRVPQATGDMERLLGENPAFDSEASEVLMRMNRLHLGYSHFIMRPMQKIARYPLLLQAIHKKARENEVNILEETSQAIQQINIMVNQNVQYSANYFTLYHLVHTSNIRDTHNQVSAGIMQKDRKLIRLEEMTLQADRSKQSVTVVLLDNCMFILYNIIRTASSSTANHQNVYEKKILNGFMPLNNITAELVKHPVTGDIYQLLISCKDQTYCLEGAEWLLEGMCKDIVDTIAVEKDKFIPITVQQLELNPPGENVSLAVIRPNPNYAPEEELSITAIGDLALGCTTGLSIITPAQTATISSKETNQVWYVAHLNTLFFRSLRTLYYTIIHEDLANLSLKRLSGSVSSFFLDQCQLADNTDPIDYLVVKQVGFLGSEELFVYKLLMNATESSLNKETYRRMYMAGDINSIALFGTHIAIASNDFELIDLEDLTTQELLDPLDKTISLYVDKNKTKPLSIVKIEPGIYLVFFSHLGFFINQYGTRKRTSILFLWLMEANDVFLFQNYVVAINTTQVKIFTLSDGILRGILNISNAKKLIHPQYLLIYNDIYLYRITMAQTQ